MLLKLSTGKVATKHQFDDECSYLALVYAVSEVTKLPASEIEILVGFPPRLLQPTNVHDLVKTMGILSGTTLTIRSNPEKRTICNTLKDMGFASSMIVDVVHALKTNTLDEAIELCEQYQTSSTTQTAETTNPPLQMSVWPIPADNSCLFNAIDFLINETTLKGPLYYRKLVAEVIAAHPEIYNTDFLERTPADYITWILNADKWGGEIELSILSTRLCCEITVVDIQTTITLTYGGHSGYTRRIFLIYDGSHYDAIVQTRPGQETQRVFPPCNNNTNGNTHSSDNNSYDNSDEDEYIVAIKGIARDRQRKRQFTNLRAGSLLCKQCDTIFVGEKQAVEHAKLTGHTNFGEVV